jgi:UDP-2-acetamido-3-amino-2,3-dideoxy-glucuronate N-acetyltransferase
MTNPSTPDVFIHPTADVSPDAKIGAGTKVWINVQVREGVRIGEKCVVSKDVYIDRGVIIGDRVKIQNGVSVYNGVTLEDDVFVGPHATFTNDKVPRAFNTEWKVTPTMVRTGASIGANATICCGIELGEYCMVASGAVVTRSVAPYTLVMGNPARPAGKIDKMGNRVQESR